MFIPLQTELSCCFNIDSTTYFISNCSANVFLLFFFFIFPSCLSFTLSGQPVSPGLGCPATTSAPTTPADTSATQNAPPSSPPPPPPPTLPSAPQPGFQSQAPSLSPALLRPPLPSLPYLLSPSCLSYSLLSASLGATRSVVMPTNTPAFSPIIATPSPVKNDVPIVQDAAGTYPRRKPTLQLSLSIESCAAFNCVI